MVIEAGGECPSSLAKDTDYLVMADADSTSTKAVKARTYGTQVINEAQFMKMIG
jgi:NAD-dependent DNA ligase